MPAAQPLSMAFTGRLLKLRWMKRAKAAKLESRMGAVAWAIRQRSVFHPRSSNRTCPIKASGSPTGFTVRHAAGLLGAGVRDAVDHVLHRQRHRKTGVCHRDHRKGRCPHDTIAKNVYAHSRGSQCFTRVKSGSITCVIFKNELASSSGRNSADPNGPCFGGALPWPV